MWRWVFGVFWVIRSWGPAPNPLAPWPWISWIVRNKLLWYTPSSLWYFGYNNLNKLRQLLSPFWGPHSILCSPLYSSSNGRVIEGLLVFFRLRVPRERVDTISLLQCPAHNSSLKVYVTNEKKKKRWLISSAQLTIPYSKGDVLDPSFRSRAKGRTWVQGGSWIAYRKNGINSSHERKFVVKITWRTLAQMQLWWGWAVP